MALKSKQTGVNAALSLQIIMAAAFRNASIIDNVDAVSSCNSRKPVSDDYSRPGSNKLVDGLLNLTFRRCVQRASGPYPEIRRQVFAEISG